LPFCKAAACGSDDVDGADVLIYGAFRLLG
jgi:hypothetical protein